jgi:glutamate synthase (NADPH/NADH) small chain
VGDTLSFDAIRGRHDAVLIATGVYKSREIEGAEAPGIVRAIDYLTASNRKGFGDDVPDFDSGELNAAGKRVVVIGGGDTAMDCVRTAVRQGAASVKCLYRRDRAEHAGEPARGRQRRGGGRRVRLAVRPRGLSWAMPSKACSVQRMRRGRPRSDGAARRPEPMGEVVLEAPTSVGQGPGASSPGRCPALLEQRRPRCTRWGTVRAGSAPDRTSLDGVFAAGDIVRARASSCGAIRDRARGGGGDHRLPRQAVATPRAAE